MNYREMAPEEISRIGEVDRAESIAGSFVVTRDETGFGLKADFVAFEKPIPVPSWDESGVEHRVNLWKPHLEGGGLLYGAFGADRLVGFVLLGPRRRDASAEVVALFVDNSYRQQGVGDAVMAWAENKARELEISALFVHSNPAESASRFYLKVGFEIVGLISKEIVRGLSGDITMAKRLE
jgi:GNAT superfamily N-acetyltransferase